MPAVALSVNLGADTANELTQTDTPSALARAHTNEASVWLAFES